MLALVLVCVFTQHSDASTSSNNGTTSVDSTLEEYWESVADNEQAKVDLLSRLLASLLTSRDVTDDTDFSHLTNRQAVEDLQEAVDAQLQALSEIREDVTSLQSSRSSLGREIAEFKDAVPKSTYVRWGRTRCEGDSTLL